MAASEVEGEVAKPPDGKGGEDTMESEQSPILEPGPPVVQPIAQRSGGRSGKQGVTELTRLGAPGAGKKSVGRKGVYPPGRPPVPDDSTAISKIPARILNAELTCPICLSIVRSTHTFMECLHRFCQECIEKYLRLGQKECPKCRVKVSSRRALRPDPQFDKLIQAFYPDIDAYEEKEEEFISKVNAESHTIAAAVEEGLRRQSQAASGRSKDRDTDRSSSAYVPSSASSSQNRSASHREKLPGQAEGEEEGRKVKGDKAGGSGAKKVSSSGKSSRIDKAPSGSGGPSSSRSSKNGLAKVGMKRKSEVAFADKGSREMDGDQRKENRILSQGRNGKKPEGHGTAGDQPIARPVSPPSPPSIVSRRQGVVEFRLWPHPTEQRVQPLKKDYVCSIETCQMIVLKKFLAARYKQEDYRAFDLLIHTTEQENALIPNDTTLGTVVRMLWPRNGELKILFRTSTFYKEIREINGAHGGDRPFSMRTSMEEDENGKRD
mmetsp:Transcript_17941/g.40706  ORF Transcript_17941/g.40706 Transcript_17941/m.40706 type:complete len:492 (-) Transcript_17941:139-1614(-)